MESRPYRGRRKLPALLAAVVASGWVGMTAERAVPVEPPREATERPTITRINPPAAPGSTHPAIAVERATTAAKGHDLLLSWLEPVEGRWGLVFSRWTDGRWTEPVTAAFPVSAVRAADRSSLTVIDTQAVRRTLIARAGDVVARSGNAGRTWSRLPSAPLPFSSFAGGDEGAYAFWQEEPGDGPPKLLAARVLAGRTVLDDAVEAGSATSATMTWNGPIVVYRDNGPADSETVAIVRRQDAQWSQPEVFHTKKARGRLAQGGGPVVAALQRQVAVVWASAIPGGAAVLLAFSEDGGKSFQAPVEVGRREGGLQAVAAVDLSLDPFGNALVLWGVGAAAEGLALQISSVSREGLVGEPLTVAEGVPVAKGGTPRMVRAGERLAVVWAGGEPTAVHALSVPLSRVPRAGFGEERDSLHPLVVDADDPPARAAVGPGQVGAAAPHLELSSLDGAKVALASYLGRPVLLNFWATWCLPCLAEVPELAGLHRRHAADGLVVVGASIDAEGTRSKVRTFVSEHQIPFSIWLDPKMEGASAFGVRGVPATFLIDREGVILLRRDEALSAGDEELERALEQALKADPVPNSPQRVSSPPG